MSKENFLVENSFSCVSSDIFKGINIIVNVCVWVGFFVLGVNVSV